MVAFADLEAKKVWDECDNCRKAAPDTRGWWEIARFYADSPSSLSGKGNFCSWPCLLAFAAKQPHTGPPGEAATIAEDLAAYVAERDLCTCGSGQVCPDHGSDDIDTDDLEADA